MVNRVHGRVEVGDDVRKPAGDEDQQATTSQNRKPQESGAGAVKREDAQRARRVVNSCASRATAAPIFPEPVAMVPEGRPLPGTDGDPKVGRSRGNAIYLFDDPATVEAKVMAMYTDPRRIHATDPGPVEGNPVFAYHEAFNANAAEVAELEDRYRAGRVGDVEVKRRLTGALNDFLDPIRAKRAALLRDNPTIVDDVLHAGGERARAEAQQTIVAVRAAMGLNYFS